MSHTPVACDSTSYTRPLSDEFARTGEPRLTTFVLPVGNMPGSGPITKSVFTGLRAPRTTPQRRLRFESLGKVCGEGADGRILEKISEQNFPMQRFLECDGDLCHH